MDKLKELINKLVDVKKLIITIWIMLWVVLIILTAFKVCFNVWYPVVSNNQKFISVCNFIDNHEWLEYIVYIGLYILSMNIWSLTALKRLKYKCKSECVVFNLIFVVSFIIKCLNSIAGMIFELIPLVILPTVINVKNKTFKSKKINIIFALIIYITINLWQGNMAFVKGLEDAITNISFLVSMMMQSDYYVFLLITWIGVSYIMGLTSGGWWWNQQITRLKALKEKELKKECPDMDVVAEYDAKIKGYEQKLKEVK